MESDTKSNTSSLWAALHDATIKSAAIEATKAAFRLRVRYLLSGSAEDGVLTMMFDGVQAIEASDVNTAAPMSLQQFSDLLPLDDFDLIDAEMCAGLGVCLRMIGVFVDGGICCRLEVRAMKMEIQLADGSIVPVAKLMLLGEAYWSRSPTDS